MLCRTLSSRLRAASSSELIGLSSAPLGRPTTLDRPSSYTPQGIIILNATTTPAIKAINLIVRIFIYAANHAHCAMPATFQGRSSSMRLMGGERYAQAHNEDKPLVQIVECGRSNECIDGSSAFAAIVRTGK
jgi:hypothetical protein